MFLRRNLSKFSTFVMQNTLKNLLKSAGYSGGATGTRTLDPMIKSHLLYQLSYSPKTGPGRKNFAILFPRVGGNFDIFKNKNQEKIIKIYFLCSSSTFDGDKCFAKSSTATLSISSQSSM